MAQHEVHCVQGEQGSAPLRLLLPKAPETQVKVLLCVAMETVGEDGHVALVAPVPSAEKEKHSHQQQRGSGLTPATSSGIEREEVHTQYTGTCPL